MNAEDSFVLPEPELNAFVDKLFAFSFVWSIAGSVQEEGWVETPTKLETSTILELDMLTLDE